MLGSIVPTGTNSSEIIVKCDRLKDNKTMIIDGKEESAQSLEKNKFYLD